MYNPTNNVDNTSDVSEIPTTSGTANIATDFSGESSAVKSENTPSMSKENSPTPSTSKEIFSAANTSKEITPTPNTSKEGTPVSSIPKEKTSSNEFDTLDLSKIELDVTSEQEMLRRRRLQKFSPPPTTE